MPHPSRSRIAWLCLPLLLLAGRPCQAAELRLALANSTCAAMQQAGALYQQHADVRIDYVCKSSGLLAKGIAGGALAADIFVSASREWMDYLAERRLVAPDKVASPWGNSLVLALPRNSRLQLGRWEELAGDKVATILIGDPSTAPFGRHAKQALEASGLWDKVKDKVATRKNIELLAESLAQADDATVGILFRSNLSDQLREILSVRKALHEPIRYYLAPLAAAEDNAEAAKFLRFLQGPAALAIFRAARFDVAPP